VIVHILMRKFSANLLFARLVLRRMAQLHASAHHDYASVCIVRAVQQRGVEMMLKHVRLACALRRATRQETHIVIVEVHGHHVELRFAQRAWLARCKAQHTGSLFVFVFCYCAAAATQLKYNEN
jgi:hypothetical protein